MRQSVVLKPSAGSAGTLAALRKVDVIRGVWRLPHQALGRYAILLALVVLHYLAYRQTLWQPQAGPPAVPRVWIPVPSMAWYTAVWLLYSLLLAVLFAPRAAIAPAKSDLGIRRGFVVVVTAVYVVEIAARWATARLPEPVMQVELVPVSIFLLAFGLGGLLVAAFPPRSSLLLGVAMAAGLVLRILGILSVDPDPGLADNLPAIAAGMQRLALGASPYGFYLLGTHVTPMAYLPWTFLSYGPAFLAGLDIRLSNVALSLAAVGAIAATVRALRVPPLARNGVLFAAVLYYLLPVSVGNDVHNEFQTFNLALVLAACLLLCGRLRAAAAAFGFAAGAMPLALFSAAPLLGYLARTQPTRRVVLLAAIAAGVAVVPVLAFLIWDWQGFIAVVRFELASQWSGPRDGTVAWPYLFPWYGLGNSWLVALQAGLLLLFGALAWARARTPAGAVALAAASYLALVLAGPHTASHLLAVVLLLALVAEAGRYAPVPTPERADRLRATASDRSALERDATLLSASR